MRSSLHIVKNQPCQPDSESGLYIVRLFNGMDGCWCDVTGTVCWEAALQIWNENTEGGTRATSYGDIDYYQIFPADTEMKWDGSEGREMFR